MLSPAPAGDYGLQLNWRGLTWEPVTLTVMRATMATMRMQIWRKKHRKPMTSQRRIWRTEGIVLEAEGIVLESVKIGHYISDL